MSRNGIYIQFFALLLLFVGCQQKKQEKVMTPWGEITDTIPTDDSFDLDDIQRNGELIALTLTGPETYYDYRGKHLGAQYLLAQRFADKLGVMLRMEVCRDTAEMQQRLADGEADLICFPLSKQGIGWMVGADKEDLEVELKNWYKPSFLAEENAEAGNGENHRKGGCRDHHHRKQRPRIHAFCHRQLLQPHPWRPGHRLQGAGRDDYRPQENLPSCREHRRHARRVGGGASMAGTG